jgi:hypothetical protein
MTTIYKYGWAALGFKSYKEYLDSPWWKNKVKDLTEDGSVKCEHCERMGKRRYIWCKIHNKWEETNNKKIKPLRLDVHHKHYTNVGNELRKDLLVLCSDCHKEIHEEQAKHLKT